MPALDSQKYFRWNWGRIARDEAVTELKGKPVSFPQWHAAVSLTLEQEGTFLVRMSQTKDDQYSISVVYV